MASLDQTISSIKPADDEAMESARKRQQGLTKPEGSLGYLEEISGTRRAPDPSRDLAADMDFTGPHLGKRALSVA